MKLLYGLLTTFLASASALTLLPPENGWAKTGSVKTLICKSSDPVKTCSWETPYGKYYPMIEGLGAEGGRLEQFSTSDKECGIKINKVEAKDDGIWTCNVGVAENEEIISGTAQSRLNIAQKPSSVLLMDPYNVDFVNVTSETMSVKCVVEDAMPEPVFVWKIDDELMENAVTETENNGQTWTQTLTYQPIVEHNNRSLICQTSHIGFEDGDEREASTIIVFASDGQDLIAPKATKPYILDPIIIVVIIAIILIVCTCVPACIYHFGPWNTDPIKWKRKTPSVEQELDEKKAAPAAATTIDETGDGSEKQATTATADDAENRDEADDAVTEVADDQEAKETQADPNAPTLTLAQRLVSFFRLRNESAPKKLDEDVESGADKEEDNGEKKEEEVEKQDEVKDDNNKEEADEKEDEVKKPNVGRFSVWKLIKWPRTVAKKSDVDIEEGKKVEEDGGEEKEKAAMEEEGEKPMVELEPEDKPEPQEEPKRVEPEPQDENKKVEPEPQSTPTKDDEEKKQPSPRTTPV